MDYKKIGFKCGIEIHQQVDGLKLFCECPTTNIRDKKADIKFKRKLRAVIGETGEVDKAAAHEMAKSIEYSYEGCSEDCCLVEMDEEPPHNMNLTSLKTALEVSKHLNAKIVDEIQVMRKTVIDGSNVSGFQRTALVGRDGFIETSKGKVRIANICIEEEACQKVKEDKNSKTYRLDRLGIPLIEIGTEPDITDPEHAKETAEKIGMILRSTGKIKRGLGTIRQDVNVSIKGGARIEIKGFQDLKSIPKVIENEIARQQNLIKKNKKIEQEVRKAESDGSTTFLRPMPGAARMYPETDVIPFKIKQELLDNIGTSELIEDKIKRLKENYNLSEDMAKKLAKSDKSDFSEKLFKKLKNTKPAFIAETIIGAIPELQRKHNANTNTLTDEHFEEILNYIDEGKLQKNSLMDAFLDIINNKFDIKNYKTIDDSQLENDIKKIVEDNQGAPIGALMGKIMAKFQGKVDGKKANELLKKLMN